MSGRNVPTGKSVLLFSGGMDSLMAARLLDPDVLLYVRHGARYEPSEIFAIGSLLAGGHADGQKLRMESLDGLGKFARPDEIIPMRNLFMLAMAAQFGERLYIGAMHGDRSLDKSSGFLALAASLFDYLHQEQHWCAPRTFSIEAPFLAETKTTLVARYLAAGHPPEALLASFSCYTPGETGQPCGQCKPCFRKWVALANNGIRTDGYFAAEPVSAPWLPAVWDSVKAGTYRGAEDAEWVAALRTVEHGA